MDEQNVAVVLAKWTGECHQSVLMSFIRTVAQLEYRQQSACFLTSGLR